MAKSNFKAFKKSTQKVFKLGQTANFKDQLDRSWTPRTNVIVIKEPSGPALPDLTGSYWGAKM